MFKKLSIFVFISIFSLTAVGFAQTGTFSGTVTEVGGDPIEGASVSLFSFGNWYSTETIEDGSFIIEDVEVGDYSASAFAWGYMMAFEAVEILEGETTVVDFVLEDWGWGGGGGSATGTFSGTVTDEGGLPIEGASVTLHSNSGWGWGWGWNSYTTFTLEDGSFLIEDVEVGEYSATAFVWGYMMDSEDVEIIEEQTTTVDFVLVEWGGGGGGATGTCSGTVTDEGGLPIEGATVTLHSDGGWGWGWNSYSAETLEDGTFLIEDVEVGEYSATAFAWGYVWDSQDIEILEDQTTVVDFVLEEWGGGGGGATGTFSGTVTDSLGTPVEGAFVSLFSSSGWSWGWGWGGNWYFTETLADGSFLIEDVEVGEYTASAFAWNLGWASQEIEILEDQTTVVDFVLEDWGWGGWDGFDIVELHGNTIVQQMGSTGEYYLDVNGDNQSDYRLNFGPDWYTPPSGAERPQNGEYLEIVGCVIDNTTPPTILAYERDDLFWRAPIETSPRLLRKMKDQMQQPSDQGSGVSPVTGLSNYPNPFNPETNISFKLENAVEMDIAVYNSLGQKVAQLVKGNMSAGKHQVTWNASSHSSGLYLLKVKAADHTITKKILLTK